MKPYVPIVLTAAILAGCGSHPQAVVPAGSPAAAAPAAASGRVSFPQGSPQLERIRVGNVATTEFPVGEVVAPGAVEANPNRIARIVVPVAGRIVRVFVALGATVQQGDPLLTVDSVEAGAAIAAFRQAEAQARSTASALNKANRDLERLKDLYEHKAAALKELVAAQNDLVQAQAGSDQALSAQQEARHRLELLRIDPAEPLPVTTLRAPIAGKVLELAVVQGEFRNDTSTPMMTIADLSSVWIAANVPESQVRDIAIGEGVEATLAAYPGETFRARVMRIDDKVDPQTRTVKVQVEIANPAGRLRPEMSARIRHSHGTRALPAVPASAVVQAGGQAWVFLARGPGEFDKTVVQTGEERGGNVAVFSGVRPGLRVVIDGAMLLQALSGGIQ